MPARLAIWGIASQPSEKGLVVDLQVLVDGFATGMQAADSSGPIAQGRSGRVYQRGLGPHSERETTRLVVKELETLPQTLALTFG